MVVVVVGLSSGVGNAGNRRLCRHHVLYSFLEDILSQEDTASIPFFCYPADHVVSDWQPGILTLNNTTRCVVGMYGGQQMMRMNTQTPHIHTRSYIYEK